MEPTTLLIALVALLVVLAVVAYLFANRRRSDQLRERFGPEYDRTVREREDRRAAEADLDARRRRVDALQIRTLDDAEAARFGQRWRAVQARFVDDPPGAVLDADSLVEDAMGARGYPVADFEQQADDVSVNYPGVVADYRAAHAIAEKQQRVGATTEELRQAMVHYRSLFEELTGAADVRTTSASTAPVSAPPPQPPDGREPSPTTAQPPVASETLPGQRTPVDAAPGPRS